MSHRLGLNSIKKTGSTTLTGDVTLTGGTNVTLTQSGNDISIAAAGGATHLFIAASTASTPMKSRADYVCDGSDDQVQINAALVATSIAGGIVELSAGIFSITAPVVWDAHSVALIGQGQDATQIVATTAAHDGVVIGDRQDGSAMRNFCRLENLTVTLAGGSSTSACVRVDGLGRGGVIKNVRTNEGQEGFVLIDFDRSLVENIDANNPRRAGIACQVGQENTWGTVTFINISANLSDASSIGMVFEATAGQSSPNKFDRIGIYGGLFFATSTLTNTTGLKVTVGATSFGVYNTLFENNNTQVHLVGETQIGFYNTTFLDPTTATDIMKFGTNNHLVTVQDCRFQEATYGFHGSSGYTSLTFLGRSSNQGNITNLFSGSFGSRFGTDVSFAGNGTLMSGVDNERYEWGMFNQLRVHNAKTPSSATASGAQGDICWDANYVYVCVASNTWKRSAIATW